MTSACSLSFDSPGMPPGEDNNCGLDFWLSEDALHWVRRFLSAEPAQITLSEGGRRAAISILVRSLPGGLRLASTYPYGGILGDTATFWANGQAIASALHRNRIAKLEIALTGDYLSQLPDSLPSHLPFKFSPSLDSIRHLLALPSTTADLDRQLGRKIRWAVGKAKRNGCEARSAHIDELPIIQSIYAETMRAKGAPVNYGQERFLGILQSLRPLDMGEVFIGLQNQRSVGMAAIVGGTTTCHLIQVAVLPKHQGSRIGELLVHTAIEHALTHGRRYFDFMASPRSDAGLLAFKGKWATRAEPIRYISLPVRRVQAMTIDLARWTNQRLGLIRAG